MGQAGELPRGRPQPIRKRVERAQRSRAAGDPEVERARKLARVMDDKWVDPILGFAVPGVGDLVSAGFSLYIVGVALHKGLPGVVVARMLLNVTLDTVLGAVPIVGDLFDLGFKANKRNLALLETRYSEGGESTAADWLVVVTSIAAFLTALLLPIWIAIALVAWIL